MVLSSIVRDLLFQFECVVGRLTLPLPPPTLNLLRNPFWSSLPSPPPPLSLISAECSQLLKTIQLYLCKMVELHEVVEVYDRMIAICSAVEGVVNSIESESSNAIPSGPRDSSVSITGIAPSSSSSSPSKPSKSDKKETVDDKSDNSIPSWIITTMALIFSAATNLSVPAAAVNNNADNSTSGGHFALLNRSMITIRRQDPLQSSAPSSLSSPSSSPSSSDSLSSLSSSVPVHAITFFFDHLRHSYSSAIRYSAGKSLGVLSHYYLSPICQLFIDRLSNSKSDDQLREFASYQRGISFLEFGVSTSIQWQSTIGYLNDLLGNMKRCDRGVLRMEICHSLIEVFQRIFHQNKSEFLQWVNNNRGVEEFNDTFSKIYERVVKWSSKSAHSMFCYALLLKMTTLSLDESFIYNKNKKRYDVFSSVISSLKSKEYKLESLQMLRHYVRDQQNKFIRKDETSKQWWVSQLKSLLTAILPKGKSSSAKPLPDEITPITETIIECGRRSPTYVVSEFLSDVLKSPSQYFTKQRVIAIRAMGAIAKECKGDSELPQHIANAWALISPIIEETKSVTMSKKPNEGKSGGGDDSGSSGGSGSDEGSEVSYMSLSPSTSLLLSVSEEKEKDPEKYEKSLSLLRASLTCFPHLRPSTSEQLRHVASYLIQLTLHEDREVSSLSASAVSEIVHLDINLYFYSVSHALSDLLDSMGGLHSLDIVKTVANMLVVADALSTAIDVANEGKKEMKMRENEGKGQEGGETGGETAWGEGSSSIVTLSPTVRPFSFRVNFEQWIALREHIESSSLLHLTHCESYVRVEMLRLLFTYKTLESSLCHYNDNTLGDSAVKIRSSEVEFPTHLLDVLLPNVKTENEVNALGNSSSSNESFFAPLQSALTHPTHSSSLRGIISTSWDLMCRGIGILSKVTEILDSEREKGLEGTAMATEIFHENWMNLFHNKFKFLCLAVRSPQSSISHIPANSSPAPSVSSPTTAFPDAASRFSMPRERLHRNDFHSYSIQQFFATAIAFLQAEDTLHSGNQLNNFNTIKWKHTGETMSDSAIGNMAMTSLSTTPSPSLSPSPNIRSLHSLRLTVSLTLGDIDPSCLTELITALRQQLNAMVASATEAASAAAAMEEKKRRKKGIVSIHTDSVGRAAYYYHEYTLRTVEILCSKFTSNEYKNRRTTWSNAVLSTLDDIAYQYLLDTHCNPLLFHAIGSTTRLLVSNIIGIFISLQGGAPSDITKEGVFPSDYIFSDNKNPNVSSVILQKRGAMFRLMELLSNGSYNRRTRSQIKRRLDNANNIKSDINNNTPDTELPLDISLLRSLHSLSLLSPLSSPSDLPLLHSILRFIDHSFGFIESDITPSPTATLSPLWDAARKALRSLLRMNKGRVDEMVKWSFSESHEMRQISIFYNLMSGDQQWSDKEREIIAACGRGKSYLLGRLYWLSLVDEWTIPPLTHSLSPWLSIPFPIGKMVSLSLIHQSSADPLCRESALHLLSDLSLSVDSTVSPFPTHISDDHNDNFGHYSHSDMSIYVDHSVEVSSSFSIIPSFSEWIQDIWSEMVQIYKIVGNNQRQVCLRLLLPWGIQIGKYVKSLGEGQKDAFLSSIINDMIIISRISYPHRLVQNDLKNLWIAIFSITTTTTIGIYSNTASIWDDDDIDTVSNIFIDQYAKIKLSVNVTTSPSSPSPSLVPYSPSPSIIMKSTPISSRMSVVSSSPSTVGKHLTMGGEGKTIEEEKTNAIGGTMAAAPVASEVSPVDLSVSAVASDSSPSSSPLVSSPSLPTPLTLAFAISLSLSNQSVSFIAIPPTHFPSLPSDSTTSSIPPPLLIESSFSLGNHHAEKRLLRICCYHISRSPVCKQLLSSLVRKLRNYSLSIPIPTSSTSIRTYLDTLRSTSHDDPPTAEEYSSFELLSNCIFDLPLSLLSPHLPLLCHNIFAVFDQMKECEKESEQMKTNIALSLSMYNQKGNKNDKGKSDNNNPKEDQDFDFSPSSFIRSIRQCSDTLRQSWCDIAFRWSLLSHDKALRIRSLRIFSYLEKKQFYQGERKERMAYLIGMVENGLMGKDKEIEEELVAIGTEILSGEYDHPISEYEWYSLLSMSFAIMKFSSPKYFQYGISLSTRCVDTEECSQAEKRRWLSSLLQQKFTSPIVKSNDDYLIDAAMAETLSNGLLTNTSDSPTFLSTLHVVIQLSSFMSDGVGGGNVMKCNNRVVLLASLGIVVRVASLLYVPANANNTSKTTVSPSSSKSSVTSSLLNVLSEYSLLCHLISLRSDIQEVESEHFTTLALLIRNISIVLSASSSSVSLPTSYRRMLSSVLRPDGTSSVGGINSSSSSSLPTLSLFLNTFFPPLCSLFQNLFSIQFSIKYFTDLLIRNSVAILSPMRIGTLYCIGKYLQFSAPNASLSIPATTVHSLSNTLIQSSFSYHGKDEESSLAVAVASLLATKRIPEEAAVKDPQCYNIYNARGVTQAGGKGAGGKGGVKGESVVNSFGDIDLERKVCFLQFDNDTHKRVDKVIEEGANGNGSHGGIKRLKSSLDQEEKEEEITFTTPTNSQSNANVSSVNFNSYNYSTPTDFSDEEKKDDRPPVPSFSGLSPRSSPPVPSSPSPHPPSNPFADEENTTDGADGDGGEGAEGGKRKISNSSSVRPERDASVSRGGNHENDIDNVEKGEGNENPNEKEGEEGEAKVTPSAPLAPSGDDGVAPPVVETLSPPAAVVVDAPIPAAVSVPSKPVSSNPFDE